MAGIVGSQEFFIPGSRFYIVAEDDSYGTLIDLGVMKTAQKQGEVNKVTLIDTDGGIQQQVDETVISSNESYQLTVNNFNLDNWALLLLANPPEAFTQSATPLTAVPHNAIIGPNKYVKIKNADGAFLYNITSIVVKSLGGGTTYVENTDWKWISKPRGVIQIISGGAMVHGQAIQIDVTPAAMSGRRLIKPLTKTSIKGRGMLIYGQNANADQFVREARISLTPTGTNIQSENYSEMTFEARILSDITDTVQPAGRFLKFYGSLPTPQTP